MDGCILCKWTNVVMVMKIHGWKTCGQILSKILLTSGEIVHEEWAFFLRGATVLDRTKQPPNPAPEWISEEAWDNVTGLAALSTFENIVCAYPSLVGITIINVKKKKWGMLNRLMPLISMKTNHIPHVFHILQHAYVNFVKTWDYLTFSYNKLI